MSGRHWGSRPGSSDGHASDSSSGSSGMKVGSAMLNARTLTLKGKKSLLHRVVPCKKGDGKDERWVYVDVEHRVTQRVCTVCD